MIPNSHASGTVRVVNQGPRTPARVRHAASSDRAPAPLFRHPGRVAIVGAGLFVVVALFVAAIGSSDTSNVPAADRQPEEVQGFSPQQGASVPPSTAITVDLRDDLTADISVCAPSPTDCTPIPLDQVQFLPGLGQIIFKPTENTDITEYPAGTVTVRVDYHVQGAPNTNRGDFTWSFQATA